jgi:hypothetical protein
VLWQSMVLWVWVWRSLEFSYVCVDQRQTV